MSGTVHGYIPGDPERIFGVSAGEFQGGDFQPAHGPSHNQQQTRGGDGAALPVYNYLMFDLELLVQTRQRVDKLLEQLRKERGELQQASKLDAAVIAEGVESLDAVIAALIKTAAARDQAMLRKGSP